MEQPHEQIAERFRRLMPSVEFCSLRIVREQSESLAVRQDVLQPVSNGDDLGVMLTVVHQGGCGYAGTSDLTEAGLARALEHARGWAQRSAACGVTDFSQVVFAQPQGEYETPVAVAWDAVSLADKIALLQQESARLKTDERIVDWEASLWHTESDTLSITNGGAHTRQRCLLYRADVERDRQRRHGDAHADVRRTWLLPPGGLGSLGANRVSCGRTATQR